MARILYKNTGDRITERQELARHGNSTISRLCLEGHPNACGYKGCCCICHEALQPRENVRVHRAIVDDVNRMRARKA